MSSEEGALPNRTTPEDETIKTCHILLRLGDFVGVRHIVNMNRLVSSKWHDEFEKAGAIADVLNAAENRLQHGLLDYYGMIRVTPPGPVLREDFEKLMNLFDQRYNRFPFCHEARVKASLAWELLSSPFLKTVYDYVISDEDDIEPQETLLGYSDIGGGKSGDRSDGDITDGGICGQGSKDRVDKRKRERDSLICSNLFAPEYLEGSQAMNVDPLLQADKRQAPDNQDPSKDTSFVPEKHEVGPGIDDEVVVISDEEDVNVQEISIARTAKLCIINGKRVKLIPLKKKQQ